VVLQPAVQVTSWPQVLTVVTQQRLAAALLLLPSVLLSALLGVSHMEAAA
jgi:hypothetical protein